MSVDLKDMNNQLLASFTSTRAGASVLGLLLLSWPVSKPPDGIGLEVIDG